MNYNKVLLISACVLIAASISYTFYVLVIQKDYLLYMHIPCEENQEGCFVGEEGNYLEIYRKAYKVEQCFDSGECEIFACPEGELGCEIVSCESSSGDEVVCS